LKVTSREYKGLAGNDWHLSVRFESNDGEQFFGMGQYQQSYLDLKGCSLELAQRNSQVSIPFALSSLGYGFLWNNPAVGKAVFGKNMTEWTALDTEEMDYWITVGDSPAEIEENYTEVTGRTPLVNSDLLGLWQCKLRYRTQDEVLKVAREYHKRGIHIDVIVIDFFHWLYQGDWSFDRKYWPDVKGMCEELHSMGIKVMVSVWPSVDKKSKNYGELLEKGCLVRTERGANQTYDYMGDCLTLDAFNPEARKFLYQQLKSNYRDLGIDYFWMDNAEPDYAVYDYENYRYYDGPALKVGNEYPKHYAQAIFEGLTSDDEKGFVSLIRSAWIGSQKYSILLWSGDIPSTFESLRDQIAAGLNSGIAGIPLWNTDIGGFMTDDVNDPYFRELLIRWYEFAVFSPFFRMHGDRGPYNIPNLDDRDFGGGCQHTGQPNELWSYGEENFKIMKKYLGIREEMKDYIASLIEEAHLTGAPIMRTMFWEFPNDPVCWTLSDQYMFGSRYLVAPVLVRNAVERTVYLPEGNWKNTNTEELFTGKQKITVSAPLDIIPVFEKTD
jgi:alpha-D-xyloside xylohydrolase